MSKPEYRKKRPAALLLSLLLAFSAGGCAPDAPVSPMEDYREILLGEAPLHYKGADGAIQELWIDGVPTVFSPYSEYAAIWKFAAADLDGDGEAEAILQVIDVAGDMGGFLILHRQAGTVYGFSQGFRSFESLKTDGTYGTYNPAAAEWSICTGSFSDAGYQAHAILTVKNDYAREAASYFIEGQPACEEDFLAAIKQQEEKPDTAWHTFDREEINRVFSPA